jgi:hypothetical protein
VTDTSQFSTESEFTKPSAFVDLNAGLVEKNFEALELVERTWTLPAMPDLVKLDLIQSPYATPESLTSTLTGIDDEFRRPTADQGVPDEPLVPRQQLSGIDQARIVLAASTSNPPPQQLSSDATTRFKLRAIDAGLLDEDPGKVDGRWSPELNRVRGELAFDDYNRSLRGDRPGAMPFNRAVTILGDLTSPAGLLSFATDLDLFWDFGAIGDEISSWGDKFRKLADEGLKDGPLGFAKNLVDALTGPVDDIVFPVINVGLMFTGFGSITNVGRVGWMGRNLARSAGTFDRIWGSSRVGRSLTSGLRGIGEGLEAGARMNLDELARPSMLASRLQRGATVGGEALERGSDAYQALGAGTRFAARNGDALARWRGLTPVVTAKRGVQAGMRMGLASYAENAFPGYNSDGASLSDLPGVSGIADRLYEASLDPRFLPLELMFAPYNIFAPGTFFRRGGQGAATFGRVGRGTVAALGTAPGRGVAGALAGGTAGALAGDDAGDIAEGAALGAGGAALLPVLGRAMGVERLHQSATGALIGAGAGVVLGDSPEHVALGALAGTGLVNISPTVRKRFFQQVGVSGLDRLLRGVGHAMVRTNYQLVEGDADISMGFHAKMRRLLTDAPDDLKQWDLDVNSYGVVGALAKRSYGKVDNDTRNLAAASIAFDYSTFAQDWIAHAQSTVVHAKGSRGARHAFHMARNKLTNQLRPIDLDRATDDIINDVAKVMAWTDTRGARQAVNDMGNAPKIVDQSGDNLTRVRNRQAELVAELRANPEQAVRLAEEHNNQIGDTINQLFHQQNFPQLDDMTNVPRGETNLFGAGWAETGMSARGALYANHGGWDNFGDFREFAAATNEIRQARLDGLFDAATLKPVTTRRGRLRAPKAGAGVDFFDPTTSAAQKAMSDMIARGIDPARLGNLRVTPLASAHEAGRVTVARSDFVTKQMIEEKAEKLADVLSMQRLLPKLAKGWQQKLDPVLAAAPTQAMDRAGLVVAIEALVKAGVKHHSARQLVSFARHHELTLADVTAGVDRIGNKLLDTTDWTRYGFGDVVTNADGKMLKGAEALGSRLRELRDKAPFTAAELDVDDMARYFEGAPTARSFNDISRGLDQIEARAAARAEFRAMRDDDIVTVYHGTSDANASSLVGSGEVRPGRPPVREDLDTGEMVSASKAWDTDALYVTSDIEGGERYGSAVVAIDIRKGDLRGSSEAGDDVADALFNSEYGAIISRGTPFTARRVSPGAMLRGVDDSTPAVAAGAGRSAEAARIRRLAADMDGRGYKLVHGVEFLMPEDVAYGVPTFADATRRHMNAVTLGNWFGRRQPIEAWARDDRRRRLLLVEALSVVGRDLEPSGKETSNIIDVAEGWLRRDQDAAEEALRLAHYQGGIGQKVSTRVNSSLTPVRLDDVGGFNKRKASLLEQMRTIGYNEAEAEAIWKAVSKFRQSDFKDMGLYGVEAELRNRNQAAGFLKMLAGTRYGNHVMGRMAGQAATGAAIGAVAGGESFEDRLRGAVIGAGVGAGVAAAVRPAGAAKRGLLDIRPSISAAEGWRYGHIADGYARLRDSLRFTLSPMFDISRFTEGMMLSQTAVPLRRPDGSRLAMPVLSRGGLLPVGAASPTGLRRRLARAAMKGNPNLTKAEAKRAAIVEYEQWVDEFSAASKASKDFDRDAIDSTGRWYRQVGIVGFSPTDWMATSYAYLRGEGFEAADAYKASREMFMYGSTGRSAAELSVNFMFFPFSFQKKALTHIGKWLNDDLGRSIILHDALKSYEYLDEKYDLDERWKDHIPYLQQMQRLNMFAYGLSPGRFGGINSQLFEGVGKVAWNAFIPFGGNIQNADAGKELQDLGRQMTPIWNDINWMLHDTREVAIPNIQGAFTPMAATSYNAQVRDGWDRYNQVRDDYEMALAERGYTLADLHQGRTSKPWLLDGLIDYEARVAEVAEQYPAWFEARTEQPGNAIALEMEKDLYMQRALAAEAQGVEPSPDVKQVAEMTTFIEENLGRMDMLHGTRDAEFAPPQLFSAVRGKAIEFADRNPHFRDLWNRFWRRDWGLIDEPMELP